MSDAPKWTTEQVLALAPDAGSAKSGRELGSPRKWLRLQTRVDLIWGECQGSAKDPYRTIVDLNEPAFACTCPSRKFPCKHALGLLLNWVQQANGFKAASPPDWVTSWQEGRTKRAQAKAERTEKQREAGPDLDASAAQAKRAAARTAKVNDGVQELERWLHDLIRGGLAQAATREHKSWDSMAARLIDAQAPGLATMVAEMAGLHATGEGWQSHLLERLARLHLLIEGYKRLETLAPETQADIRTLIGWTQDKEALIQQPGLPDMWQVLGQRVSDDSDVQARAPLRVQRTWLLGQHSQRHALLLSFAVGAQTFDVVLGVGSAIDAELVFYPSNYPLRGMIKTRTHTTTLGALNGHATLNAALTAYGQARAKHPWLTQFPMLLNDITPVQSGAQRYLVDQQHCMVELQHGFAGMWPLLAMSGSHPVTIFGEWDGDALLPLTVWAEDRMVTL